MRCIRPSREEQEMTRYKTVTIGTLVATVLTFAPLTPAWAGGYYGGRHGGYHAGSYHGGHGYHGGYRYGWPVYGLAAAGGGTAGGLITAPVSRAGGRGH